MIDLELREKVARLLGWWVDLHISAPLVNGVPVADKMYSRGDYHCTPDCLPAYETDVAAAWEVVEFMDKEGWTVEMETGNGLTYCRFRKPSAYVNLDSEEAIFPAAAICKAFVTAMENNHES